MLLLPRGNNRATALKSEVYTVELAWWLYCTNDDEDEIVQIAG